MKMPNITPGDWECAVSGDGEFLIFAEESFAGASIIKTYSRQNGSQQVTWEEAKANAQAITALPEVFNASVQALKILSLVFKPGQPAVKELREALLKAGCTED